jgi:hypothetical protein
VSSAHSSERAGRLAKASTSYDARAWTDTFEAFFAADEIAPLGPSDLERYATSAYMLGNVREMLAIQERAHRAYLADGDTLGAARAALWLATNLASRGKLPQASGWVEVSERLLQSAPEDCVERGYLPILAGVLPTSGGGSGTQISRPSPPRPRLAHCSGCRELPRDSDCSTR